MLKMWLKVLAADPLNFTVEKLTWVPSLLFSMQHSLSRSATAASVVSHGQGRACCYVCLPYVSLLWLICCYSTGMS